MKLLIYFFKYNWKTLFVSCFAFSIIWQIYTAFLIYGAEVQFTQQAIDKEITNIEKIIIKKDIIELKELLWNLKGDHSSSLVFAPKHDAEMYINKLKIGSSSTPIFSLDKSYALVSDGAWIGEVKVIFDFWSIATTSLKSNIPLYCLMTLSILIVMFIGSYGSLKSLVFIERAFSEIEEKSTKGNLEELQNVLIDHVRNHHPNGFGKKYASVMSKFLVLAQEKGNLDKEIEIALEKYRVTRILAHNLKSPLNTFNLIVQRVRGKLSDQELKLFEMAYRAFEKAITQIMVKDVDLQDIYYSKKKQNIIEIVDRIVRFKQREYQNYPEVNLSFVNDCNKKIIQSNIPVDPLFNIMSNVINNAYDAIDGSGKVSVSVSTIVNNVQIKIADSGKGIPGEVIDSIWDDNFSYQKRKGNGLGLADAKRVLEGWKGSYGCESSLGLGTSVSFSIPLEV
jgi:signal transduction histidine kinase